MNELNRHISLLLERNECVILPGLGGFVTTRIPAHYDEKKGLFFPPYRTLAFQAGLTIDDGLLIQSFMESEDLSYPDAAAKVDNIIQDIKTRLIKDGYYELDTIGRLSQDMDGNYHFSTFLPPAEGISSPEFYGLTPVNIVRLAPHTEYDTKQVEVPIEKKHAEEKPYPFYPKKGISIHFSTSTLNKIAGIVIMFLLVFLFATPFGTLKPVTSYSGFTVSLTQDKPAVPTKQAQVIKKSLVKKTFIKKDTVPNIVSSDYCIVLASGITRTNGNAFIQELSQNGIKASLFEKGKMRRVIYSSFKSKEEAQNELSVLRKSNNLFATAWVMKK